MSVMPGRVTRTQAFEKADAYLSSDLKAFEAKYKKSSQIDVLLKEAVKDNIIGEGTSKHVTSHWLQLYWPKVKRADRILQRGLYWAVRLARYVDGDPDCGERQKALPLCSVWVCTGEYGDPRFEVVNLVSDYQVTVVFLTPPPEKELVLPDGDSLQKVWSTRCDIGYPGVPGEKLIETFEQTVTVRPVNPAIPE